MATKAINTLKVKTAVQLAASDYLVGHDAGNPAAFRSRLDQLAAFFGQQSGLVAGFEDQFFRTDDVASLIAALNNDLPITGGTFTPSLGGSTGDPTVTYTTRAGQYMRMGKLVAFGMVVSTSAYSGGSGNIRLRTLPAVAAGTLSVFPIAARAHNVTWASGSNQQHLVGRIPSGGNAVILDRDTSGSAVGEVPLSAWPSGSAASVSVAGVYMLP